MRKHKNEFVLYSRGLFPDRSRRNDFIPSLSDQSILCALLCSSYAVDISIILVRWFRIYQLSLGRVISFLSCISRPVSGDVPPIDCHSRSPGRLHNVADNLNKLQIAREKLYGYVCVFERKCNMGIR